MTTLPNFDPDTLRHLSRPRYGNANPEKVENSFWQFMITSKTSPWTIRTEFGLRSSMEIQRNNPGSKYRNHKDGPLFSPYRFGQSTTQLPDGRIIYIAGEYEDFYDPDFCIYNDVIVQNIDKQYEFYIYPQDVFLPTDFHTATLIGEQIYIIGSVGYGDLRRPGYCPVYALNINTLKIASIQTTGASPGWISGHSAEYMRRDNEIIIKGGKEYVTTSEGYDFIPSERCYALMLEDMRWTCA